MATVSKVVKVYDAKGGEIYSNSGNALVNGNQSVAIDLGHSRPEKSWQLTGTFGTGGSIQLEASNDGSTWVVVGTALTAAGLVAVNAPFRFLRFNVTAGDGTTALIVTLYVLAQRGS